MIVEIPDDNSIVKWKMNDKDEWKVAEISDLIKAYETHKGDLISREALRKQFGYTDEWYKSRTVAQIIDNAPTVEMYSFETFRNICCKTCVEKLRPQGEWIPISERLPDADGCYLVSLENGQIIVSHSSGIIENHDFEPKMLAWQPLPDPYKEGGVE